MPALLKGLHNDESGQGLVEYLLIIALVALAATAGMSQAASYINSAFIRVGQKLGQLERRTHDRQRGPRPCRRTNCNRQCDLGVSELRQNDRQ